MPRDPEPEEAGCRTALNRPGFWYGRRLVARLRAAHTAAGLLTVAAAVGSAAARHDREPGGSALLAVLGVLLEAVLVAGACAVVWVVCRRGRTERRLDDELDAALVRRLPLAALVLLALPSRTPDGNATGGSRRAGCPATRPSAPSPSPRGCW
ncbi:hypothetical protein SGRIM128S_06707 [Streptomyces griseomycini]